jgi:hypothetical protein
VKKLALGIVAVLTVVGLGLSQTPRPQTPRPTQTARPEAQPGRYQIFFSPLARADVYLVDTATGRIWRPMNITNAEQPGVSGNPQVWMFQDRVDNSEQLAEWFSLYRKIPAPSSPEPSAPASSPEPAPHQQLAPPPQ